jgi:UDP-N-acetylmuramoylalanine--D-glutamate ligase
VTGSLDVHDKRVLVYSMGIEGRDLASYFVARGAEVTMSDTRNETALEAAGAAAPDGVARTVTGQPLADPAGFDLVAPAQSILRHDPAIVRARELGIPVVSQMQLFLRECRGRTVGITGSSGKTTTTSLVAHMVAEAGIPHVVGGNIGRSLLGEADSIASDTLVILEISHTQLQYTDRSPDIAAITNVTPNHLDQFSWNEYVDLKRNILRDQDSASRAVLNRDDPVSRGFTGDVNGQFFESSPLGNSVRDGARLVDGIIRRVESGVEREVIDVDELRLRGVHNQANTVMATAVAAAIGLPDEAIHDAAASFRGVAHRIEPVGRVGGVLYVNDSIATAPERTMAGMRSFDEPIVLLLGGREKNLPVDDLRALVAERCRGVVCFGEAGPSFARTVGSAAPRSVVVDHLEDAVAAAARIAQPGDVVLLSPGGTSFDAYPRFEARGEAFRAIVQAMPGFEPEEEADV